jgi:hypothetical protein
LVAFLGVIIVAGDSNRASAQSAGLENVLAAHRSHRDSITTFRGHVKFEQTIAKKPNFEDRFEGDFWISPAKMRMKYVEQGETWDTLVSHSVRTSIIARPGNEFSGTRLSMTRKHFHRCDPYVLGLLVTNVPGTIEYCFLEALGTKARRAPTATHELTGGRASVRLDFEFDWTKERLGEWNAKMWLDPQYNYAVFKAQYEGKLDGKTIKRSEEVMAFSEVAPGIMFPTEIAGDSWSDSGRLSSWKCVMTAVRVNEPLPDTAFVQRFPNGLLMVDGIRNSAYRVDGVGQRIGPEKSLGDSTPPPPLAPSTATNSDIGGSESEEQSPWGTIAVMMLLIAMTGASLFAYRRVRN